MTVWYSFLSILGKRRILRKAGVLSLIVVLVTTLFSVSSSFAAPSTNKTVNFQARLMNSTGSVVADGYYNIQFNIYQDGDGTTAGNPGGTLKWSEAYVNNGNPTGAVRVKNGYLSVNLGSVVPFGSSVDWDADPLWLSMNIGGADANCTSFGAGPCAGDGEMLPMKRITATPYSINSGAVGGKTADNLVQLAQGVQTDASTNTSSIHINKTGTGNLIQLQNTAQDVFTVGNTGNLTLGSNADKSITVATSATDTAGRELAVVAGAGGSGNGADGGDLKLQGGAAGGTNGNGGDVAIDAGAGAGSGSGGTITIGAANAREITVGSTTLAANQTISIGGNNTAGSTTNVTVGSGELAAAGTTTIRAKNAVTINTNGTDRATFSDTSGTVYFGNGVSSSAPDNFTLQGTNSSTTSVAGGTLTVQGGNATTGNANGGNVVLAGGSGSGTGSDGLVVLTTPTFSTVTNDANCYPGGTLATSSCTVTNASVNKASAILVGFGATGQTATLPDPTNTTPGRIVYVMAAPGTQPFSVAVNGGGAGNTHTVRPNSSVPFIWNGSDWTIAGSSGAATLQDTYDNSMQAAGNADLVVSGGSGTTGGLTIRDNATETVAGPLLDVQNANAGSLFSINNNFVTSTTGGTTNQYATNPGAEVAGSTENAFPAGTWSAVNTATVQRTLAVSASGNASVQVSALGPYDGAENQLTTTLEPNTRYNVSFAIRLQSGSFTDLGVYYTQDGEPANFVICADNNLSATAGQWKTITCSFTTPASGITSANSIGIDQLAAGTRTFYIDDLVVSKDGVTSEPAEEQVTANVQVGNRSQTGAPTLFTLDKSSTPPSSSGNHDALLGSMYYDEAIGKIRCYEANGWGSCGSSPDTFVSLSPQYPNSIIHGTGTGTISTGICSDMLNINDGSSGQPSICGTNETQNYYQMTYNLGTAATRSIFVTYQLPGNFKEFIAESTSLKARTSGTLANTTYQIYRNSGDGLTACGSVVTASTGNQTRWQNAKATGTSDPRECGFEAGDNIVVRINLAAQNNQNAYASDLTFAFSND